MSVKRLIVVYCTGCLLLVAAGCRAGTESTRQTTTNTQSSTSTTQQASSPQASAPNSNGTTATSNVSGDQSAASQNSNTTAAQPGQKLDPCSLITPSEIASLQGEEVKETRAAPGNSSRLSVAQCFYQTTTPSKSVSLELTQRLSAQPGALSPREFWKESFEHEEGKGERGRGRESKRESERESKREAEKREASGGEEEEGHPAIRVAGVGDEAFWASNVRAGALYVLKGNSIIRISVGGIPEQNVRLEKSKALARLALQRLKD
jgi:hypothetical protein